MTQFNQQQIEKARTFILKGFTELSAESIVEFVDDTYEGGWTQFNRDYPVTPQVKHPQLSGLEGLGYRVIPNYTNFTISLLDPDNELIIESSDHQVICDKIDEILSDLVDDHSDKWGDE